jgi:DNA-binding beta-propeller fold protein YncE
VAATNDETQSLEEAKRMNTQRRGTWTILMLAAALTLASPSLAGNWGVVITGRDAVTDPLNPQPPSLHTIDCSASPPAVYGPFLQGQLGVNTDAALDVVILKDRRSALVSTFGAMTVSRIDLSDPTNPVVTGTVLLDDGQGNTLFAEDIEVTRDGKLALVTDGGLASAVAFIDLGTFTLKSLFPLPAGMSAQAVAIARNGTVLLADYSSGKVHSGRINETGDGLADLNSITLCDAEVIGDVCQGNLARPVNIAISPNGKTALVANAFGGVVNVLKITGPGQVEPGAPFFLEGLPGGTLADPAGGQQSISFRTGKNAYVVSMVAPDPVTTDPNKNLLSWIRIGRPGTASVRETGMVELLFEGTGAFFGVDVLAVKGRYAVAGCTVSFGEGNSVAFIDLKTHSVTPVPLNNNGLPFGVALGKLRRR